MKLLLLTITASLLLASGNSFAMCKDCEEAENKMVLTKEQREAMVAMHENMAKCLKSDKSLADCKKEAMDACKLKGTDACPFMMHDHEHHKMKGKKAKKSAENEEHDHN